MKNTKKFLSIFLAWMMIISIVPMASIEAEAVSFSYDADAAITFAKEHCETDAKNNTATSGEAACDEGWLCAEFVAECLLAGGFPKKLSAVAGLGGFGGQITEYGEKIESTKTGSGYVKMSTFEKKLSKGDPIVILYGYGNGSGNGHVVIYSGETASDGTVKVYAHNNRNQNGKLYADSRTVEIFAVHINSNGQTDNNPVITSAKGESHSEVVLKWKALDNATKYKVERRKSGTDDYVVAKESTTSTSFTDSGLETGQRYFYKVTAYNGSTKLGASESVGVYTKFLAPDVTAVSDSKLKVSWDSVSKAVDYTVMRRKSGDDAYEEIKTVTGTSYEDSGLLSNTKYYYYIKANCNVDGIGIIAKSTSSGQYTLTKAPIITGTNDTSKSEIYIEWDSVDGASSYRIERRKAGDENYITVKSSTTETSFTDSGLLTGQRYYYRVYAKNSGGESASSNSVGVYTKAEAPTVTVMNDTQLKITWNGISGAESYTVMRRCYSDDSYLEVKTVTDTTYTDTGLANGTKYYYWIKANCVVDDKEYVAKSTTGGNFTQLSKPTATVLSDTKINLTWKAVDGPGGSASYKYVVQRKLSSESSYKNVATVTSTTFSDTGLTYSSAYNYRIQVVDSSNAICTTSDVISAKTLTCSHLSTEIKNVILATCTVEGYTGDTYCKTCGTKTKTGTKIEKASHNYTETIITQPTCTEKGYTTYTCECGDSYVEDYVNALGHTPANAVEENYLAPTCSSNGSVDKVVYCSVCNEELSRTTEAIEMLGHADNDGDGYCDMDNEPLDSTTECDCNCHKSGISKFFFNFALFFQKLFGANKTCDCGVAHY